MKSITKRNPNRLQAVLGLIISMACLGYVLYDVDFSSLWEAVLQVTWYQVALVNLLLAVSLFFRSLRWRTILGPVMDSRVSALFSANLIGFMANNVMPARLGEFVRAHVAARLIGSSTATAFGTVIIERIADGLALVLFLFMTLSFADPTRQAGVFTVSYLRAAGHGLVLVYVVVITVILVLGWRPGWVIGPVTALVSKIRPAWRDSFVTMLENLRRGLGTVGSPTRLIVIALQTIGVWLPAIGMYLICLPAVGLPMNLFLASMAFASGIVAAAVPAGPGLVGTFQLAVMWGLMLAGVPKEQAANFAMIFWAVQYFPLVAVGLAEMWRRGFGMSIMAASSVEDQAQAKAAE